MERANRSGTLIVIEGTDGSGKTEQCRLLVERLQTSGFDVSMIDFPQYGQSSAYFVENYLNGHYGVSTAVRPKVASVMYALDRFHLAAEIRKTLQQEKIVIANRYTASNMGHQGAKISDRDKRRELLRWIHDFEYVECGIPKPNLNIFLHVPHTISYELISRKHDRDYLKGKKRDIHEADSKHLKNAEQSYLDAIALFPRDFKVIECAPHGILLSMEAIHQNIVRVLPPGIKKRIR